MNINVDAIGRDMIAAAKGVVDDRWPATRKYFESESQIYAFRLASIEQMFKDKIISESRAKDHIKMQNKAWQTTLLSVSGLSQIMVEEALNAAINVIRGVVNKAIGFELL